MGNEEHKIINSVRDRLLDHEIPYEEGMWESFQEQYAKELSRLDEKQEAKLIPLWRYAATAAAAVILILLAVNFFHQPQPADKSMAGKIQKNRTSPVQPGDAVVSTPADTAHKRAGFANIPKPVIAMPEYTHVPLQAQVITNEIKHVNPAPVVVADTIAVKNAVTTRPSETLPRQLETAPPAADIDYLAKNNDHAGRWKFGVELNPAVVSDRINVGVGISTQYEISKRIRLATGLSYSSMKAIHKVDAVQVSADTSMTGAQSVIKALDIPLSIIYERDNGWYAAVGVSALAVLKENKVYEFTSKTLQESFSTDPVSGESLAVFNVVETQFSEKSTDTDFRGRSNLGYINLAIGRQYKFYSDKKILLEPFVKIPVGNLQNDKINLLNSGIRIRLLF